MKIAIIGAGLSGLTAAYGLKDKADVTVFEKSRGVGGRMSTRYADPYQFDHGAQYFTARSKKFKNFLKPFIAEGIVQEWMPKIITLAQGQKPYKRDWFEPHYVAAPKMTSLCKRMAENIDVNLGVQITKIERTNYKWLLTDQNENSYNDFDWVISSAPAPQTQTLFPNVFQHISYLENTKMLGCYSLMLGFKTLPKFSAQAAIVKDSPIGWIAVNSSKSRRDHLYSLLIQTANSWAEDYIDHDRDDVQDILLKELEHILNQPLHPDHIALHGWRYASTSQSAGQGFLIDYDLNLAACGDWCIEGRVESAYLSGTALAEDISSN